MVEQSGLRGLRRTGLLQSGACQGEEEVSHRQGKMVCLVVRGIFP